MMILRTPPVEHRLRHPSQASLFRLTRRFSISAQTVMTIAFQVACTLGAAVLSPAM